YRRARYLWPHRSIIEEGALAPLHHRFRIKIVAAGELLDRSLRSLYSSSDGVRGLGAAVKNLSHRASRNVASAWLIPRHSGTAHLASRRVEHDLAQRFARFDQLMRLGGARQRQNSLDLRLDLAVGGGGEAFRHVGGVVAGAALDRDAL